MVSAVARTGLSLEIFTTDRIVAAGPAAGAVGVAAVKSGEMVGSSNFRNQCDEAFSLGPPVGNCALNPGRSITNSVEDIAFQVCDRFEIPAERLVWLEHYDYDETNEWSLVTFGQIPPAGPFADPKWHEMTKGRWKDLRLWPKKQLRRRRGQFDSKLRKLFHWPDDSLI